MRFIISILTNPYLVAIIWVLVGIGVNTAPPHYPSIFNGQFSPGLEIHSLVQYVVSVLAWPLSFVHPAINTGKWTPL